MTNRSAIRLVTLALALGSCAPQPVPSPSMQKPPDARPFSFTVFGDLPYNDDESDMLRADIQDSNQNSDSSFLIHVGDMKSYEPCEKNVYTEVAEILKTSKLPVFILPGDNDWNDCENPEKGWALWTETFLNFEDNWKHSLKVVRQEEHPENWAFRMEKVMFIGLHVVSDHVPDPTTWRQRLKKDAEWVAYFLKNYKEEVKAAVILAQAGPKASEDRNTWLFRRLGPIVEDFEKPVLYVHGDLHVWEDQKEWMVPNLRRISIIQGGKAAPLDILVDPNKKDPFEIGSQNVR